MKRLGVVCQISICAIALALLSGCETAGAARASAEKSPPVVAASEKNAIPTLDATLLDGFEGPEHTVWAFDSADDEGNASYVSDGVTQGQRALKVALRGKGAKGKLHLRRDVLLDLSQASGLLLDVSSTSEKISVAFALKCDPGDIWQESKPIALKNGANAVRFPLDAATWKHAESKWEYSAAPVNLAKVKRLILLFFTGEESAATLQLDNLRVEGADAEALKPGAPKTFYREWRPEIVLTSPVPRATSQFRTIEQQVVFRASYKDIFDPNELVMGWRVVTPSGKPLDVRGFFSGLYTYDGKLPETPDAQPALPLWGPVPAPKKKDDAAPAALEPKTEADRVPVWLVRFTPQETGRHTLQLYVRNAAGETRSQEHAVVVAPEIRDPSLPGRAGGNVRISRRDPMQLELQDGSPFYIFGQNVCWTQDWKPYLEKIKAYGGNTCRIWLCPWGLNLEKKTEPGVYDLSEARRLDRLLADAEATGVRIIFCFTFHGATADVWHDSPYNQANGGPCGRAEEFFSDWKAKRQFKRLLSYAVSRWSASPALLSWELINEMDLAKFDSAEDVAVWSKEMAAHLKAVDVHNHLVTTSSSRAGFLADLWQDARIDFICMHGYGTDVSPLLRQYLAPFQSLNKPLLLAEFGGGWKPEDDIPDKNGARLQAALWLSACSPSCGAALPWWWDTYIEARDLYGVMASAARFVQGDDRRGRFKEWVKKTLDGGVEASGIMDTQGARIYVHHPGWTKQPETRGAALPAAPQTLELTGMLDGAYRVEFWDAAEGKSFSSLDATATAGKLSIELPARKGEFALKIDRREFARPGIK